MKKLYEITVYTTALVYADDASQAVELAEENLFQITSGAQWTVDYESRYPIRKAQLGGFGYDEQCIPWGTDGTKTIGELDSPYGEPA